jgi:hypothetical protein
MRTKLVGFGVLLGLLLTVVVVGAAEDIAIVKSVAGQVEVKRSWQVNKLKAGDNLESGDILMTGPQGRVGVIFNDGSTLALAENSYLRIDDFIFKPIESRFKFHIYMEQGTALFGSGKIGKLAPEKFKFEIPRGTIGIRGTKFLVEVRK